MPAVSREHVSSLLNFIVQLASRIRVLESLGGLGGGARRGEWLTGGREAKAPVVAPELQAVHQGPLQGRVGSPGQRGVGDVIPPPQGWGYLSDSRFQ